MKTVLTESASVIAEKLLNGSLSGFSCWLESKGVDPFKRPLIYKVDHDNQVVEIKQ